MQQVEHLLAQVVVDAAEEARDEAGFHRRRRETGARDVGGLRKRAVVRVFARVSRGVAGADHHELARRAVARALVAVLVHLAV